jgi:predicted transglutaminase-like cysteine proteinase
MLLTILLAGTLAFGHATLPPMQWTRFTLSATQIDKTIQRGHPRGVRELEDVNQMVNSGIIAIPENELAANNSWEIWPSEGWCGDYAVTKRHELLKRGWPSSALLLAVVGINGRANGGAAHAILLVYTGREWLALDNLTEKIRLVSRLNYQPIMVQGADAPNNWYVLLELPK